MTSRRHWLKIFIAAAALALGLPQLAQARDVVPFPGYETGTVVIVTHRRELYYVLARGQAIRYPVGVGRAGMAWTGNARVEGKFVQPAWAPPESIRAENPRLPKVIPGGSPYNPMGAAALTLRGGEYAIHGTNNPGSIGGFVSHGCIRMYNSDIRELYRRVDIGTPVVVER